MAGAAVRDNTQLKRKAARARLKREMTATKRQRPEPAPKKIAKPKKQAVKKPPKNWGAQFRLFLLLLATVGICQLGFYLYSQNGPLVIETLKFPGRIITACINGSIGGVTEGFNGIIETEQQFANQTFAHAETDPMMIPVGIVSAAVAIPVGFISKAPNGMMAYGKEGYAWWDEWFPPRS